jgi:glucokinase
VLIPALEVGGTHVSAGLVDSDSWSLSAGVLRLELDARADADALLDLLAQAGTHLAAPAYAVWGVGMPDPFDYAAGIGRFHSVAKFEALDGVDVRAGLLARLDPPASDIRFVNDAEAFLLGEWVVRGAPATARWAALTLGTGVGSGSLVDGELTRTGPDIPPGGRVHLLEVDGRPLEDVMSRRALMRAYRLRTGVDLDVREISEHARDGEDRACEVITVALSALGAAVAPWLRNFDTVVLGGSMTRSWDVLGPPFVEALATRGVEPDFVLSADVEASALIGAAYHARDEA